LWLEQAGSKLDMALTVFSLLVLPAEDRYNIEVTAHLYYIRVSETFILPAN
jgi:hypothetical protein